MGQRVTSGQIRDILSVARKLRFSASNESDEDYVDLFVRAAEALEARAQQLAFHPFDPELHLPELDEDEPGKRRVLHKPVNLLC